MSELPLTVNTLHKEEMEYYGNFGHNLCRIQHISIMSRIYICHTDCRMETQTVAPTLPGFQGIRKFIQYLDSYPH